jgi:hypothetical protein
MTRTTSRSVLLVLTATAACAGSPSLGDADAPAPQAAFTAQPRLKVQSSTDQILDPDGNPILLRGYNWGQWDTASEADAESNVQQGANSVRIPLRWWGAYDRPDIDSYDPDAPDQGYIDTAHLLLLDQTLQWARDNHLWVTLFLDSNQGQGAGDTPAKQNNFWTNQMMKDRFKVAWQFLVKRYRDRPFLGAYEILPEPHPLGQSNQAVHDFYDEMIGVLRPLDGATPIVIGPNDSYNLKFLEDAFTTADPTDNLLYTGDYFIFAGDTPTGRVQHILDFQAAHPAAVWINQVGIHTGDPCANNLATQVLDAFDAHKIGWSWWTYREQTTNPGLHGIFYQITDSSPAGFHWQRKADWFALVGGFFASGPHMVPACST